MPRGAAGDDSAVGGHFWDHRRDGGDAGGPPGAPDRVRSCRLCSGVVRCADTGRELLQFTVVSINHLRCV